jgi:hypothetical protein
MKFDNSYHFPQSKPFFLNFFIIIILLLLNYVKSEDIPAAEHRGLVAKLKAVIHSHGGLQSSLSFPVI